MARKGLSRAAFRAAPGVAAFLVTLVMLVPQALTVPQHVDEVDHAFTAEYYGNRLRQLNFSPVSSPEDWLDPAFDPNAYWSLTQPMGPRYIYAAALAIAQAPPLGTDSLRDVVLSARTRTTMRFTAVSLAALGLFLIAYRFGWAGLIASVLFLSIPHVPADLARGWAEGPLLFGFGLAAATWGTRGFAPACGLAAVFKLNALPLWPLAFYHGFGHSRYRRIEGIGVAWLLWTALEPPAWYLGGPLYLFPMLLMRWFEYGIQSGKADPEVWGGLFGHYFPTRYLWPFELAMLLGIALLAPRVWARLRLAVPVAGRISRSGSVEQIADRQVLP